MAKLILICRNTADANAALETAKSIRDSGLFQSITATSPNLEVSSIFDGHGISLLKAEGSIGHIAQGLLADNDCDICCFCVPGTSISENFLTVAVRAMEKDPGLAAYALVPTDQKTPEWDHAKLRKELSSGAKPVPKTVLFRQTIAEQLDYDLSCDRIEDLNFLLLTNLAQWFRTRACFCSGGKNVPLTLSDKEKEKSYSFEEETPFDALMEDYLEYKGVKDASQTAYKNTVAENAGRFSSLTKDIDIDDGSNNALSAVGKYYEDNDVYMDELAYWHCFRYWDGWWTFSRFIKGRFLEYGGGLGTMSAFAMRQTSQVDYFDINKKMVDFVNFRISKRGWQMRVLPVESSPNYHLSIKEEYDTICAIDVIEHIPNWQEATTHLLSRLKSGGTLIQHTNFGRTKTHPMHFDSDIEMSDWLADKGMKPICDKYRAYKGIVWQKP